MITPQSILPDGSQAPKPLIISGPCSAESEDQVLQTALRLAAGGKVRMLRAGIWKPRTRPGMFEGVGEPALAWLKAAGVATGLPVTVEVATGLHVEQALKAGIDVLWIGARTTVNPFSVQEVADALRGVNIPVMIKNPVNPDIELWNGAFERIAAVGIERIALIHRGFSAYGNTEYRNAPIWQIPIEMKRRHPDRMMICDPSHICGNRHMLQAVAQQSIDLDFDGLMIESHIDPDNACSDAAQQITPERLNELLAELIIRDNDDHQMNELALMRQHIDRIDDELLTLLSRRMTVADKIGRFKKENKITILQSDRWNEMLSRAMTKGEQLHLSKEFLVKYFDAVHLESINHQNKVMNPENTKRGDAEARN